MTYDLMYGPMWYRLLNNHAPLDVKFADQLSEMIAGCWPGMVNHQSIQEESVTMSPSGGLLKASERTSFPNVFQTLFTIYHCSYC